MNKMEIIPEIAPDINRLKDILAMELPECKFRIKRPPLYRNGLIINKSFNILTEVVVQPKKITVRNATTDLIIILFLFCVPYAIYLMFKRKESEAFRSKVYEIVLRATRNQ
jgi:hypothetical protein